MSRISTLALGVMASSLALATAAQAHPRLVASSPANGAVVHGVRTIQLQFSEQLVPAFTGGQLMMNAMPGMPGMAGRQPMPVSVRSIVTNHGRNLRFTTQSPLRPGSYHLDWHAVSTDTHRVSGGMSFTVK